MSAAGRTCSTSRSRRDLAPNGFGPFDLLSAFARVAGPLRLHLQRLRRRADLALLRRPREPRAAQLRHGPHQRLQRDAARAGRGAESHPEGPRARRLLRDPAASTRSRELGADERRGAPSRRSTTRSSRSRTSTRRSATARFPMGPWQPDTKIDPIGSARRGRRTRRSPLPLRPQVPDATATAGSTRTASSSRRRRYANAVRRLRGLRAELLAERPAPGTTAQSQDERELKEAYLDLEMFDGRLWMRAGKQNIVWGKTELFRTTDQFNPQTSALSSLPSLEESRIALWSVRGDLVVLRRRARSRTCASRSRRTSTTSSRSTSAAAASPTRSGSCAARPSGSGRTASSGIGPRRRELPARSRGSRLEGLEFGARVEWRWDRFSLPALRLLRLRRRARSSTPSTSTRATSTRHRAAARRRTASRCCPASRARDVLRCHPGEPPALRRVLLGDGRHRGAASLPDARRQLPARPR